MAKRRKSIIPGYSWRRALGVTKAKQKIARATGVPTTKRGRQQKIGRMITGGGCILPIISTIVLICILIFGI